ncbi:unnamed protein product [Vitrella brassicaformis CCMP3155]|uniref:Carboxylesterase type B domain-containing protein n=1 Tax=Vitrella brassicaformis (strain CCMP3155) TaxID=1169540 RepID=A0A0G4EHZ5_VITBC|nr:unnamed protein product [Vitrella brassicaformis CCMP3155]|eukprot:CEL95602.1 unnamed protein product [Vitrella brassicaformis CCMP3155]
MLSVLTCLSAGIRYATAERFKPAQEVVYQQPESFNVAENKGNACISGCGLTVNTDAICESPNGVESEDCLFLSIWRPTVLTEIRRQITIVLHGGGFLAGSGMADFSYVEELARRTGSGGVRRLCRFDELTIKIWGFSAGAKLAACLLTSPATPIFTGLQLEQIDRVILSSGSWGLPLRDSKLLKIQTETILKTLKCIGLLEHLQVDEDNGAFIVQDSVITWLEVCINGTQQEH